MSTPHPSEPRPDRPTARLSAQEATDLAGQVAVLAQAGLPLGPGLRAVAEELRGSRVASVLARVAADLDAGKPLDEAMAAQADSFPAHLRRLIIASAQSGRLAQVLERFVATERQRVELRRRIWANLAYPLALLVMILVLSGLMVHLVLPQVHAASRDILGVSSALAAETPDTVPLTSRTLTLTLASLFFWLLLSILSIGTLLWLLGRLGAPQAWQWFLERLPILGAVWRWSRLAQFARLMEVLIGEAIPLPEALRLSGEALRASDLAQACREAASRVEAGASLSASVAGLPQFPPTLVPFLDWGRETNHLGEAFRAAAEAFEARVRGQVSLLESILMPAMFLLVIATVVTLASAIVVPLVQSFRFLI